ncbi:hypothetical protein QLQ12_21725 [Actinoplanes sp. NEAU-A12]|uniref:Scaffolding protein n=1 Tax=Actinoplanes sandaracinus TaxID=3045177 RepID=A0ABT6WNA3_9ACTN|nr:hypothetical protein [Actinoplanes sandaracinus]MDI6101237.1 hypothetical protein [Actinoplanes sandaracinus]
MCRTARRTALSGVTLPRVPRGGWYREDPTDNGVGRGPGHDNGGGDTGKVGDNDSTDNKTPKIEGDFDADRAQRALAAARGGENKAKAAKKAADDRLAAVLKAAGLTPDGKEDPAEQLKAAAAERDKAAEKLRDKSLRLAVRENADKAGVDPAAVIDSTSFRQAVAELDVDAADYDDQVVAAMKKALKTNPRLAADSSPPKGAGKQGADHSGQGGQKAKPKNLTEAIAARLGG